MTSKLLEQQQALQDEADQVLEDSGILTLLSEYGTVHIGGSYKTGLMVWRDIDLGVTPKPSEEKYWELSKRILYLKMVKNITLQNNSDNAIPYYPNGYYIGIKIDKAQIQWKIDIWLVNEEPQKEYGEKISRLITDEQRLIILQIKDVVHKHQNYRKTFHSVDIYDAVLENEVKTIEEFIKYLHSIGKSM